MSIGMQSNNGRWVAKKILKCNYIIYEKNGIIHLYIITEKFKNSAQKVHKLKHYYAHLR